MANKIKSIDRKSIHQLCSGQVVLTLAIAVKELVENSIDAGATNIEIKLKEFGSEVIEISDNGCGVRECDFESLTLKHHTSKLQDFSDLLNVGTFGFRGEALSSLCALCKLTIVTCHKESIAASRLEYDNNGSLIKRSNTARQVGTTVILENIFSTLPVRHKEFHKNLRKEFGKMIHLLTAYCIISTGKRITCVNTTAKGRKNEILSTNGETSIKAHITSLFGVKQVSSLMEIVQCIPTKEILEEYSITDLSEMNIFKIEGFISSHAHGEGRSTTDRQFFFINGRPCDLPNVAKLINDIYHSFNKYQYPFICLNIIVSKQSIDVNVTPDKRQIFVSEQKLLLAVLKSSILTTMKNQPLTLKHFSPLFNASKGSNQMSSNRFSQSTLNLKRDSSHFKQDDVIENSSKSLSMNTSYGNEKDADSDSELMNSSMSDVHEMSISGSDSQYGSQEDKSNEILRNSKSPLSSSQTSSTSSVSSPVVDFISTQPFKEGKIIEKVKLKNFDASPQSRLLNNLMRFAKNSEQRTPPKRTNTSKKNLSSPKKKIQKTTCSDDVDLSNIDFIIEKNRLDLNNISKNSFSTLSLPGNEEEEDVKVTENKNQMIIVKDKPSIRKKIYTTCDFSLENLKKVWKNRGGEKDSSVCNKHRKFRSKLTAEDAEDELRKEISKEMFVKMDIIGQFNLGFIITRFEEDLFIIDQHATDEKYNFEILQRDTVLETQLLLNPQTLQLTAAAETTLCDNMQIFEKNGFKFKTNEENAVGRRICLESVPVSQNWIFGKEDVDELIFMLTDNTGTMCRPSRVLQMFASRACRKSVMIGTALSHQLMKKIVHHMGEIEQPWNCPHGRPTMRHLLNLNLLK